MGIRADGSAWPSIGKEQRTTYGGMSGNAIRPIALKVNQSKILVKIHDYHCFNNRLCQLLPKPCLDSRSWQLVALIPANLHFNSSSAELVCFRYYCSSSTRYFQQATWSFGLSTVKFNNKDTKKQIFHKFWLKNTKISTNFDLKTKMFFYYWDQVCSAVQNQDFTVVDDYIVSLKALIYLRSLENLKDWDGQSPPVLRHQKGKPLPQLATVIDQVRANRRSITRPRKLMLLKMTKYGLKNMLSCSKNSEKWSWNHNVV